VLLCLKVLVVTQDSALAWYSVVSGIIVPLPWLHSARPPLPRPPSPWSSLVAQHPCLVSKSETKKRPSVYASIS
jgi:hypothetical protein